MKVIRHMRIKKFRSKNLSMVIVTKILVIVMLFTVGLSYLTSNTGAYYNDTATARGIFTAGFWEEVLEKWDKSSLKFIEPKKDITVTSCNPITISATIKNTGNDMQGSTEYIVYHVMKGNPMNGEKVYEGKINPIKKNETINLEYSTSKAGNYKFKALQRPGHGNKYDVRHELWSETITVQCKESSKKNNGEDLNGDTGELQESDSTKSNNVIKDSEEEIKTGTEVETEENSESETLQEPAAETDSGEEVKEETIGNEITDGTKNSNEQGSTDVEESDTE